MKQKRIRHILQNADDRTIEKIAENYPMSDDAEKESIYQRIQERLTEETAVSEDYEVSQGKFSVWKQYAGLAAAFLLVIGSIAGEIILMNQIRISPGSSGAEPAGFAESTDMQAVSVSEETAPSETLPTETEPEELTKELLYSRSARTNLYLTQLSGHIELWTCDIDSRIAGDVLLDFDKSEFYGIVRCYDINTDACTYTSERYTSEGRFVTFNENESDDSEKSCHVGYGSVSDRNNLTDDPTGLHELAGCFRPIEMTGGYLADLDSWDITATEIYQNRECAVLEGITGSYGAKWNTTHWKIIMDVETGTWLFYEGYDDDGTVNDYIHTSDIVFGDSEMIVPVVSEDDIDAKILTEGYTISEQDAEQRELRRRTEEPPTEFTENPAEIPIIYEEPETMPEPFAPDSDKEANTAFWNPFEQRFNTIWPELAALVPEEEYQLWMEKEFPDEISTSVRDYRNMYSFIQDFGLSDEDVREAMQDYIAAWDADASFRGDELGAILSENEAAMLNYFASWYSSSIIIGNRIYTPAWLYEHPTADYTAAGITAEIIREKMRYYQSFDLTEEASEAFLNKLNYFIQQ